MTGDDKFREELLALVTGGELFTRAEASTLIRSVRPKTPEGILDAIEAVVTWARNTRTRANILSVILTLGEADAIDVRPCGNGDIEMKLNIKAEP